MDFERRESGRLILNDTNRQKMKTLLDSTGPGFCLAKWTQVTMHLGAGLTHSCHHPTVHSIPLTELAENPGALHNTTFKKEQRKKMLNGERPAECDFCWRIEDNTGNISDRVLKSMDSFSINDHDDIAQLTGDENVFPRYVEVSFSNVCNLKCSYCGPTFSSKWVEEVSQHGAYKLSEYESFNEYSEHAQIKNSEDNPYTDAFWKWWPEASKHMHTFRITGGEPLLSKHTMKTLKFLLDNPNPELEVAVNSNGCPPQKIWLEFTDIVNKLISTNSIKKFTLFVSAESVAEAAEFSRTGMDWNMFTSNVEYFLDNTTGTRVTFMAAFNIFSLTTIGEFLEYVLFLKKKYNKSGMLKWIETSGVDVSAIMAEGLDTTRNDRFIPKFVPRDTQTSGESRVGVDIPYVRSPKFLDAHMTTIGLVEKFLLPAVDYMYRHIENSEWFGVVGFETWEALKLKRIFIDSLIACKDSRLPDGTTSNASIANERANFHVFMKEYQKRRKLDFLKTFPEMAEFAQICELEYNKVTARRAAEKLAHEQNAE